jgi:hypothetical protein
VNVPSVMVGAGVPGRALQSPSTKVTRTPWSAARARRSAVCPPLRTNSSGVRVTASNPAAPAAAASSGKVASRNV